MKFLNLLLMSLILTVLLGSTYYLASHKDVIDVNPCEIESSSEIYLALDESLPFESEEYQIEDETIISVEDGKLTGLSSGETKLISGCHTYTVYVSDLYSAPVLDMDKGYLPEGRYSSEENRYLDSVLEYLIDQAGYQTRAAAVEAARFLTLRFKYKLNYFYENGRMEEGRYLIDAEGRYYHKGLYLSMAKALQVEGERDTSDFWGSPIYEWETGTYSPNGLDCSGFITWALYNAGFDCGDIGAGPSEGVYDLTDLGKMVYVSDVDLGEVKCGDLAGLDGHIGMIIGMDEDNIYIAESYWVNDLQVRVYNYDEFIERSEWYYVILMDEYYQRDGNYTDFWN